MFANEHDPGHSNKDIQTKQKSFICNGSYHLTVRDLSNNWWQLKGLNEPTLKRIRRRQTQTTTTTWLKILHHQRPSSQVREVLRCLPFQGGSKKTTSAPWISLRGSKRTANRQNEMTTTLVWNCTWLYEATL
jgi:hypothetical protein